MVGKFKSKTTPTKKKSRYGGLSASGPRTPMAHVGEYVFEFVSAGMGTNPQPGKESWKFVFTIQDMDEQGAKKHKEGQEVMALFLPNATSQGNMKSLVMALAGYDDEEEYDQFDPDGEFIDALVEHTANDYTERAEGLVGVQVPVEVMAGGDDGKGEYYRNYNWGAATEKVE